MEYTLMIIDDNHMNRKTAQRIFSEKYDVVMIEDGRTALSYLEENLVDVILLDVLMPDMDGYEVIKRLKENPSTQDIPVIFLTAEEDEKAEVEGFEAGAADYIRKPFHKEIAFKRIDRILELRHLQKNLENEVAMKTRNVRQASIQTVRALANAVDAKDPYTNGHSMRVSEYSVRLARSLGWNESKLEDLRYAALLHDVGKIGVPDNILNKPGKLTDVEYEVIKSHTVVGGDMLESISVVKEAWNTARHHHERFDGKGYPDHLQGEGIPEFARVVGIADAYDAMNSKRIYRKPLEKEFIRKELVKGLGTQFDPEMAECFLKLLDEGQLNDVEQGAKTSGIAQQDGSLLNQGDALGVEVDLTLEQEAVMQNQSLEILKKIMSSVMVQSQKDKLDYITGLDLRAVGERRIAQAMLETNGCLAFIDLDNLKLINDTVGHVYGDKILGILGQIIRDIETDTLSCRLGGDEFLLFIKSESKNEVSSLITELVEKFHMKKMEEPVLQQASLSIGLCMSNTSDTYQDIYNKADKALYHVKQNGKNGYFFYKQGGDHGIGRESIDLKQLVNSLENKGRYTGALDVDYREFTKLFEYTHHLRDRYKHGIHMVMVTLEIPENELVYSDQLEAAMRCMEQSIQKTIRSVDVCTRYSNVQFLIILLEAGDANIKMILERIFKDYYACVGDNLIPPTYDVAELVD